MDNNVLVLLPMPTFKLLAKWQGLFAVGEVDYKVRRTNREDALQIYYLSLLISWRKKVPLALVVSEKLKLGLDASPKSAAKFTLVPSGDQPLLSQQAHVAWLQEEFSNVFSPLPSYTNLIEHHIEIPTLTRAIHPNCTQKRYLLS